LVVVACSSKKEPAATQEPVPPPPVVVDAAPPPPPDAAQVADEEVPEAPDIEGVAFKFEVTPSRMKLAKADKALMRITVTNNSKRVISPVRLGYEFTVDGEDSMQLNMSFGNGGFARPWGELPPGQSATSERRGVEHLELAAGTHEIVMYSWDRELARTTITLTK
jgi:hypothetical protein